MSIFSKIGGFVGGAVKSVAGSALSAVPVVGSRLRNIVNPPRPAAFPTSYVDQIAQRMAALRPATPTTPPQAPPGGNLLDSIEALIRRTTPPPAPVAPPSAFGSLPSWAPIALVLGIGGLILVKVGGR